jgi:predicted NBD/HSP70 family sugar kinase
MHRSLQSLCVSKFGASIEKVNNERHLIPAAREGDEWALGVLRRCIIPLGYSLAVLIVAAGLDRIIISGGIAQSLGQTYVELLVDTIKQHYTGPGSPFDKEIVQLSTPDAEVCLLGAATYAHMRLCLP